jgi:serine/threonine protein kinase
VASSPLQPIPESTQVHVDRLVGTQVGEFRVVAKAGEGRYGTLYRAQPLAGGDAVTLQVLRTGVAGHDEEVRAANALKCDGIATAVAFGTLDDGRRYRVFALAQGDSLEQLLERRGPLAPGEAGELLAEVALVLETAHAWSIGHGSLGTSGVLRSGGKVKVIDFGLARERPTVDGDLRALGSLGVALLAGQAADDPPAQLRAVTPGPLTAVLKDLLDGRLPSATAAKKELQALAGPATEPAPAVTTSATAATTQPAVPVTTQPGSPPPSQRSLLLVGVGALLACAAAVGLLLVPRAEPVELSAARGEPSNPGPPVDARPPEPPPVEAVADAGAEATGDDELDDDTDEASTARTSEPRPSTRVPRAPPSARALQEQISRLEARLRKKARPGDDLDQALFVLNKQRLRLTGDPSVADRQDVARQLAGWRKSYLRP